MKSTKVEQATMVLQSSPKSRPCRSIKLQMLVIFLKAFSYCVHSSSALLRIFVFTWSLKFHHRRFVAPHFDTSYINYSILCVCITDMSAPGPDQALGYLRFESWGRRDFSLSFFGPFLLHLICQLGQLLFLGIKLQSVRLG